MPLELRITPASMGRVVAAVYRDGKLVDSDTFNPHAAKARRGAANRLRISEPDLLGWADEVRRDNIQKSFDLSAPPPSTEERFVVRELGKDRVTGEVHQMAPSRFVKEILPNVPLSHVAEWKGQTKISCLDVDYHDSNAPDRRWLEAVVLTRLLPRPYAWHFSRSGGLHLFYVAIDDLGADELAAVAALRFRAFDATAGLELKDVVRGPGDETVTTLDEPDSGGSALTDWFASELDDESRDEWLRERGMTLEGRYDHSRCPICPTPDEPGAKRDPVVVGDHGIYCFVCEGKGRSMGCRRPGFAPWPVILGAPSSGDLGRMVRNLAHWGHARWVLRAKYGMPDGLDKLAYSAALKAYHAGKPTAALVPEVFNQHTDEYAHSASMWCDVEQSHTYKDPRSAVECMPAAMCVDENGRPAVVKVKVDNLLANKDHGNHGYPDIETVHGFKVAAVYQPSGKIQVSIINPALKEAGPRFQPKYIKRSDRMPEAEAWAVLETVLPKIDRKLIETAICAFATSQETRNGMNPMVFVSGPSASGKTSQVKVAAGIVGSKAMEAVFDPTNQRFRESLKEGKNLGCGVLVNEILKDAGRGHRGLSAKEALDPLLNITPDSLSHVLYQGQGRFGRVPAIFLTEPQCPLSLHEETQIARRVRHHPVVGRKDEWKATLAQAKCSDLHLIRTVGSKVNAACDAIMSYVCDRRFGTPQTWDQQADAVGVPTIEEDPGFKDSTPQLIEFFQLVCGAPEMEGRTAKIYGKGFKKISRGEGLTEKDEDLCVIYSHFADGNGANWIRARKLEEKDWAGILKTGQPVSLDLNTDGANVYARFRVGSTKNPVAFNGDIDSAYSPRD